MKLDFALAAFWELEEASGTRRDATGNGNNLTPTGAVSQVTGKVKKAAGFSRSQGQYLSAPDADYLSIGAVQQFGIAAWVNLASQPGLGVIYALVQKGVEFQLRYSGTPAHFGFFAGSDGVILDNGVASSAGPVTNGTWHLVCGWWDGANLNIQVDHGTVDQNAYTAGSCADGQPLTLGAAGPVALDGDLDQVGLWRRGFTTADLAALWNSGNGLAYAQVVSPHRGPRIGSGFIGGAP